MKTLPAACMQDHPAWDRKQIPETGRFCVIQLNQKEEAVQCEQNGSF